MYIYLKVQVVLFYENMLPGNRFRVAAYPHSCMCYMYITLQYSCKLKVNTHTFIYYLTALLKTGIQTSHINLSYISMLDLKKISTRHVKKLSLRFTIYHCTYHLFYLFGSKEGPVVKVKEFGLSPSSNFFHLLTTSKP